MGAYFIDRLVTWHSQGHAYIATIFFKELFAGNGQVFYAWNSISFKPYAWFHRVFQGFFYYLEHILPCKHCVCYAYFHFSFTLLLSLSLRAFQVYWSDYLQNIAWMRGSFWPYDDSIYTANLNFVAAD